jgi:O-antigen ligase
VAVLATGVFVYANFGTWYSQMKTTQIKYNDDAQAHLSSVTNLKSDASNLERINRWYCAIEMGKAKPILGFGPGTYQFSYDAFQRPDLMTRISTHHGDRGNAHSEYLGAFAETGVLGLLLLVALALWSITCVIDLNRSQRRSPWHNLLLGVGLGLVTFWVHGFFNSFMDTDKVSFLVYTSIAFITQMKQHTSKGEGDTFPTTF